MSRRRQSGAHRSWEQGNSSSSGGYRDQAVAYTDGSCFNNGGSKAQGGYGVYWGPNHPLNVSEKLDGRPTNQRAELEAARRALEQAHDNNIPSVNIRTDSKYTVKGMTEWIPRWKENGWKTYGGEDVVNKTEFQKLDRACEGLDVTWTYVPGHRGELGNEMADQLAKSGARK